MGLEDYLFGFKSESKAAKFLIKNGYSILERNFHSKFGEIDIIALKDEILHFIEVKATEKEYETIYRITKSKMSKICKTVDYYILKTKSNYDFQIDAILIEGKNIKFIENISF